MYKIIDTVFKDVNSSKEAQVWAGYPE